MSVLTDAEHNLLSELVLSRIHWVGFYIKLYDELLEELQRETIITPSERYNISLTLNLQCFEIVDE